VFATGQLEFPMTEAEWGVVMTRIETVAQHFDSTYRDMVLSAFWAPSQRLRFQPPILSFATESIEIEIGGPMDISPPHAFGDEQPIVLTVSKKGKEKATEPAKEKKEKKENKESNIIWEMKTFNDKLHDPFPAPVSGDLSVRVSLLNLCCSVNAARLATLFAFRRSRSSCRHHVRARATRRGAIAASISIRNVRCPRVSFRR